MGLDEPAVAVGTQRRLSAGGLFLRPLPSTRPSLLLLLLLFLLSGGLLFLLLLLLLLVLLLAFRLVVPPLPLLLLAVVLDHLTPEGVMSSGTV